MEDTDEAPEPILLALHPELLGLVAEYREAKAHEIAVSLSPGVAESLAKGAAWVENPTKFPTQPKWPGLDSPQEEREGFFEETERVSKQIDQVLAEQSETFGVVLDALTVQRDAHQEVLDIASEIADMLADALAGE